MRLSREEEKLYKKYFENLFYENIKVFRRMKTNDV